MAGTMETRLSIGGCTYFNPGKEWPRKPGDPTVSLTTTQAFDKISLWTDPRVWTEVSTNYFG